MLDRTCSRTNCMKPATHYYDDSITMASSVPPNPQPFCEDHGGPEALRGPFFVSTNPKLLDDLKKKVELLRAYVEDDGIGTWADTDTRICRTCGVMEYGGKIKHTDACSLGQILKETKVS